MPDYIASMANGGVLNMIGQRLIKYGTWGAWGVLGLALLGILILSFIPSTDAGMLYAMLFFYGCALLPAIGLSVTWLMATHYKFFGTWLGWSLPILGLLLGNVPIGQSTVGLFLITLQIICIWAVGVATVLLVGQRNVGLQLAGWMSVILVWAILLAWRFQGNLIELWVDGMNHPNTPSPLWWMNMLWCVSAWVIPFGLIGFFTHTLRLFVREFREK